MARLKSDELFEQGRYKEFIKFHTRQVRWLFNNSNKCAKVVDQKLVWAVVYKLMQENEELKAKLESGTKTFKMPTSKQLLDFAIVIRNGDMNIDRLTDMIAMAQLVIDRLYENGNILKPSSKEK